MFILLKALHVFLGAFWFGAVIVFAFFIEPAVRAAGAGGGAVMMGIGKRKYSQIVAAGAGLTILTGLGLFGMDSRAAGPDWMHSRPAMAYSVGAVAALAALFVGLLMVKPSVQKIVALMSAGSPPPAAEVNALFDKLQKGSRTIAVLLMIAIIAMAVARYL
jgi:uncharacterized membrane protein